MVLIPGGAFLLGLTESEADALARELVAMEQTILGERQHLDGEPPFDAAQRTRERREALQVSMPAHEVEVGEFYIDRFPVTVGEYARYMKQSGAPAPDSWRRGRPSERTFVTGLSWREASQYADHEGLLLPSEAEWERAARNGRQFFTWGDSYFPQGRIAFPETGSAIAWEVGSRRELASVHGVQDLIGEFGEYTSDKFVPYPGTNMGWFEKWFPHWRKNRAVRGGYTVNQDSTTVYRNDIGEDDRARDVKFRGVRRAIR